MIREEDYKNRAESIAKRLKWLETEEGKKEKKTDSFIIWVFAQIEERAVKEIKCVAGTGMRDNIWRVRCGENREYFFETGKDDEIYIIMQEVAKILNKTEKVKAKYNQPEISGKLVTKNAELNISINL